jgi:DNA-binding transcriptional regulator YiaG
MTELQEIRGMLEVALQRLDEIQKLVTPKRAPLTRAEFARLTGYSYRTVCRWVESGRLRVRDGRIPALELDQFMS